MESAPQYGNQLSNIIVNGVQVDPNTFTLETYLALVKQLDLATSTQFDHDTYKQADMLLQQFSKTHQAWSVTTQVLTMPGLSDQEYFNAANMLKNKMMYDFASLRQQEYAISFQIRDNLILIIKRMASEGQPRHLLNSLCTALAILIMHINENWRDFVEQLASELSDSTDHATCLLLILKYMAADCDNDSIVIEDSIRHNFFHFIDQISGQVFDQIFNQWAQKILASGLGQIQRSSQSTSSQSSAQAEELETLKMQRLRSKLVEAFYHWIKLRIPDQVIQNLPQNYPALIQLVFAELENNNDENLENATNCVIELIQLAKKKEIFSSIKQMVIEKVQLLVGRVKQAVSEKDEELGEQLMDIFVELGLGHIEQIIESKTLTIPQVLLELMKIPEIKTRRQVTFWKTLFKNIDKIQIEESKKLVLQAFEPVLLPLLEEIINSMRAEDEIFEEFNYQGEMNEVFDDILMARDDFGRLIKTIGTTCGGINILQFYLQKLQKAVTDAQEDQTRVKNWAQIESILVCIAELTPSLKTTELGVLRDVVSLVYQLPTTYAALKRTGSLLFSQLSTLMKGLGDSVKDDVKQFLDYVIKGLDHKHLIIPCARAFNILCTENAQILSCFAENIVDQVIPSPSANKWQMKPEYEKIIDGISAVVEEVQDNAKCEELLKKVIQPFIIPLVQKIQSLQQTSKIEGRRLRKSDINEVTLNQIQTYQFLIGDFLKGCQKLRDRVQNPYVNLFEEIWNFIKDIIVEFNNLDEIVEYAIRIVKSSLRILGPYFDKYLVTFLQIVVRAYQENSLPSCIYAVEFCLVDYQSRREFENIFQEAFNHICDQTTKILVDFDSFEQNPEIAFDFFGICMRLLKNCKTIIFSTQYLQSILKIWTIGIGIEHRDAVKTHTGFFLSLVSSLKNNLSTITNLEANINLEELSIVVSSFPDVHPNEIVAWKYLLDNGQAIVDRTLQVIMNAPSRDVIDYIGDIAVAICFYMPPAYKQAWFSQSFLRVPGNVLTDEEKQHHLDYLIRTHKKKDGLLENFDMIAKRARNAINRGH